MSPSAAIMPHSPVGTNKHKKIIENEKQISVDPTSIRESEDRTMHPVVRSASKTNKFISCSLPNSATSSPRFDSIFTKHKKKIKNHQEQRVSPLARQHSVALSNLERLRESHLRRSKSCGEGRLCQPSVDFDLQSTPNKMDDGTEGEEEEVEEEKIVFHQKKGSDRYEEKFKCGACMFLPGFGKGKTVRARKEVEVEPEREMVHIDIASQRVSLEKFECGSWRSSAIMNHDDDGDAASNLFFDLPVELIQYTSYNDTESPVTTGFVFDKDHHHRKGVLKNTVTTTRSDSSGNGQPRKSSESCNSSRHVRFSTTLSPTMCPVSPTCITPHLRNIRDDFDAFLEAQSV